MPPLITIGLPSRNAAATLPACLRSIFAQTLADWELIAVDDGSTDDTGALLERVADARVRSIRDGVHRGLAARLNQIAREARGEFLARMDADDLMFPERLQRQVAYLSGQADVDIVGAGVVSIGMTNEPHGLRLAPEHVAAPLAFFRGDVLYHPTIMGRTAWFRAHPYDEAFGASEDVELWTRTASHLRIANLSEPLLFYRETGNVPWRKYWAYSQQTKRALRWHGPAVIGRWQTARCLAKRAAKDAVYGLLYTLRLRRLALALRNRPLTANELARYKDLIRQVLQTPLPGIG